MFIVVFPMDIIKKRRVSVPGHVILTPREHLVTHKLPRRLLLLSSRWHTLIYLLKPRTLLLDDHSGILVDFLMLRAVFSQRDNVQGWDVGTEASVVRPLQAFATCKINMRLHVDHCCWTVLGTLGTLGTWYTWYKLSGICYELHIVKSCKMLLIIGEYSLAFIWKLTNGKNNENIYCSPTHQHLFWDCYQPDSRSESRLYPYFIVLFITNDQSYD